jgi:hypothetical protein
MRARVYATMLRAALLAAAAAAALAAPDADAFARSPAQRARIAALRETHRLRDAPPVGGAPPQYLDGEDWIVTSADGAISTAGSVPGDLITDLQLGGLMGDPIYVRTPIGRAHGARVLGRARRAHIGARTTDSLFLSVSPGPKLARVAVRGRRGAAVGCAKLYVHKDF